MIMVVAKICLPFTINSNNKAENRSKSTRWDHEMVLHFELYILLSSVNLNKMPVAVLLQNIGYNSTLGVNIPNVIGTFIIANINLQNCIKLTL